MTLGALDGAFFPAFDAADPWILQRDAAPADDGGWLQEGSLFSLADGVLVVRGGLE